MEERGESEGDEIGLRFPRATTMEDLPAPVLVEVLSRVGDSIDLANCRLASRTLRSLSYDVRSVQVICSRERFVRSRSAQTRDATLLFTSLIANLASLLAPAAALESLALAVDVLPDDAPEPGDIDEADDLYLSSVPFLTRWLPLVSGKLRSLEIADYWRQSCWRTSQALALISDLCHSLIKLEISSASLSVLGLKPMQNLTSLTLEFIRLDDANLDKLNECFPSLQRLKLLRVGGLKEPKIHLLELQVCQWTVSHYPRSLSIYAPKLVDLKLKCVAPESLILETPLLFKLDLAIEKPTGTIKLGKLVNLRYLRMESSKLCKVTEVFEDSRNVKQLELERDVNDAMLDSVDPCSVDLARRFPIIDELILRPKAWRTTSLRLCSNYEQSNLKKLRVHLLPNDTDASLVIQKLSLLLSNAPFRQVMILFPVSASVDTRNRIFSMCTNKFPKLMWQWDTWYQYCFV